MANNGADVIDEEASPPIPESELSNFAARSRAASSNCYRNQAEATSGGRPILRVLLFIHILASPNVQWNWRLFSDRKLDRQHQR